MQRRGNYGCVEIPVVAFTINVMVKGAISLGFGFVRVNSVRRSLLSVLIDLE